MIFVRLFNVVITKVSISERCYTHRRTLINFEVSNQCIMQCYFFFFSNIHALNKLLSQLMKLLGLPCTRLRET